MRNFSAEQYLLLEQEIHRFLSIRSPATGKRLGDSAVERAHPNATWALSQVKGFANRLRRRF